MARTKNDDPDKSRNGVRLRSGLPESNGLAPIATNLVKDKTQIVWFCGAMRTAAITENVENDSRTASMKIISIEADFTDEERTQLQLILDRARVRRTGEEPLFDESELVTPPTPITRPRSRR